MAQGVATSDAQKAAFLHALRTGSTVTSACASARMSTQTAYLLRLDNPEFRAAWEQAKAEGEEALVTNLEDEADRRAFNGYLEPVFHEGVQVGSKCRYSDTLLIFRLKALRPDRYRERAETQLTGPGGGPVRLTWGDGST